MFETIILGAIQGVAEWLPISSSALVSLVSINFFGGGALESISLALFLHIGTFAAALVYYWREVCAVLKSFFHWKSANKETKQLSRFLSITTVLSLVIAGILFLAGEQILFRLEASGRMLTGVIGLMLLATGIMQIYFRQIGERSIEDQTSKDSLVLGAAQGLAVIPGISRSGITIAALLLRQFKERDALRLSFLMSLPIVLIGNIALQFSSFRVDLELFVGAIVAFIFGLLTIHILVKVARSVAFGYLALLFGIFSLLAVLV